MLLVAMLFLVFLTIGMPVAFAIGIAGIAFFLQHPELPFSMVVQLPISQTQNSPLLAVPLFIFAGNLMNSAGITERLIRLSTLLTGHIRGGLAQVSVVLSTLMGGVSGSATISHDTGTRVPFRRSPLNSEKDGRTELIRTPPPSSPPRARPAP